MRVENASAHPLCPPCIRYCHVRVRLLSLSLDRRPCQPGPKVIKLFEYELILQIVLRALTRIHTQEVQVIKLFLNRTHTLTEYINSRFSKYIL